MAYIHLYITALDELEVYDNGSERNEIHELLLLLAAIFKASSREWVAMLNY